MRITVTYYLDVISSWCFFAEPAWAELKKRYEGKAEFQWRIALLDKIGLPASREQEQWFYRRSGTIMRSPFMFNSEIGDRAVFSGFVRLKPFVAAVESMLDDTAAYAAHKAHFGEPPP